MSPSEPATSESANGTQSSAPADKAAEAAETAKTAEADKTAQPGKAGKAGKRAGRLLKWRRAAKVAPGTRATLLSDAVGRGFARLTVLPALGVVAWLLVGLPLLLVRDFLPVPELLIAAPLLAALAVNVLHRLPARWPVDLPGKARDRGWMAWFGVLGTVVVAVAFTACQIALSSPSVIATRTPGAYFQAGYWIAQHGSLPIPAPLAAFGGAHLGLHVSSSGFFQSGHVVVPAVSSGLPMLLAAGFWTSGIGGGAVIGPVLGGLAVLSFGGLAGRLAGRHWAPAGALALALTLPELYVSRDAFSEPAVQILLFGGLSLVIDALTLGDRSQAPEQASASDSVASQAGGSGPSESGVSPRGTVSPGASTAALAAAGRESFLTWVRAWSRRSWAGLRGGVRRLVTWPARVRWLRLVTWPAAIPWRRLVTWPAAIPWRRLVTWPVRVRWRTLPSRMLVGSLVPERMLAALGGLAIGLTSLLSVGSLVYLIAVIIVAGVLVAARPAPGLAFCLGMTLGVGYGIAGGYLLALPLMNSLAPTLEAIGRDAGGAALITVVAAVVLRPPGVRGFARRVLARRPLRWLPGLGSLVVLATIVALAVRPSVQTVRRVLGQAEVDFVAALQRMAGLHVDPTRLYSEYTLYWVIWYAGAATVLLGGFGAAVLARRGLRAALTWRDSSGAGLAWAMPLALILGGSAAVLWQPFTVPDQPWASRRLVPVVLPGLILLGTWMAAWLTRRARARGAGTATVAVIAALCVGSMLIPSGFTSFGIGLTHSGNAGGLRLTATGLAQHRVGSGEADAVRGLCSAIGRSSSVLIVDRRIAGEFAQVIRGMCGVPVAWMGQSEPVAAVDAVLGGIVRAGRHPVVLGASSAQVARFGGTPVRVMNLITTQEPHALTRQAGPPWPARYVIWMTVTGASGAGI